MIPDIPGGPAAWGIALFVFGVFWRGWTERTHTRPGLGGVVVTQTTYSVFADVFMAAGIALFLYGVFV